MLSEMESSHLPQARADRLIAMARLVIALFTLLAVWLDPLLAGRSRLVIFGVAIAFALYAVIVAIMAVRLVMTNRGRVIAHVAEFLLYSVLIQHTQTPVVFYIFWIFCGMLRFGTRGAIITASIAVAASLIFSFTGTVRAEPATLALRFASLLTVSLLVVSFGAYESRLRSELSRIAVWPQSSSTNRDTLVSEALGAARNLLNASVASIYWEESEEPWVWFALSRGDEFKMSREGPDFASSFVSPDAGDSTFLASWSRSDSVIKDDGSGPRAFDKPLVPAATRERLKLGDAVVSSCVKGDLVTGRLLLGFQRAVTTDDMPLTEIVARLIAARLDHTASAERMRDSAVGEERIRVARDLHDGVLQSLTGAALQLESVVRMIGTDDDTARARVRNVQQVIEADQRELRSFITQLRPEAASPRTASLLARLQTLGARYERQWNVVVTIALDPPSPSFSDSLAGEIYNIVNEATANAAKHAGGTQIDIRADAQDDCVVVTVQDDGRGFPFHGTYDLTMLDEMKRGPVTLKERVASLNGNLRLQSTPRGTRLEVTLPL